jgi:hypothetical protein
MMPLAISVQIHSTSSSLRRASPPKSGMVLQNETRLAAPDKADGISLGAEDFTFS